MINQKKGGILLAYCLIALHSMIGIFLTPFFIRKLGNAEFGLYQLVNSFAACLVIMDLGTGTAMTRFVSKYIAQDDEVGKQNYIATGLLITAILSVAVGVIGSGLYLKIEDIFKNALTMPEINKAKELYVLMIINIAISLFDNAFVGISAAYEKFIAINTIKIIKIILRVTLLVALLELGLDSLAIIATDLFLTITFLAVDFLYCKYKLKVGIKLHKFDKVMFFSSLSFSLAIFLQLIINQVNSNAGKIILGMMTDTTTVSVYAVAMQIFIIFSSIPSVIASVFLPHTTKLVFSGANNEELTDLVIRPGRYQFMLAGGVIAGFLLLGQNFIRLWIGNDFIAAWLIAVIIMIPSSVELIQNVTLSILNAQNKRAFRSGILLIMAIINIIITIILVGKIGYIGAAIGTCLAIIMGDIIIMNIYYQKVIGLNIKRMFGSIFAGILPCLIATSVLMVPFVLEIPDNLVGFTIKSLLFSGIYGTLLYKFGLNEDEKNLINFLVTKLIPYRRLNN